MTTTPPPRRWDAEASRVKREEWLAALTKADGNVSQAGRALGISRRQATNLMNEFELVAEGTRLRTAAYGRKNGMGRPPKARAK